MDNLITGTNTVEEAIKLYHGAKTIFKEASMNLRDWSSNSHHVNQVIDFNDRASCDLVKVLGHNWNLEIDPMTLKMSTNILESASPKKRNCGRPWLAAYINFNQNTHQIQVFTKPLCRAQAIFYSLPNNDWGTKYRGVTYSASKLSVKSVGLPIARGKLVCEFNFHKEGVHLSCRLYKRNKY